MRFPLLLAALACCASTLSAQQHLTGGNEGKRPLGWQVRADAPAAGHDMAAMHGGGADTLVFAQMTPGFHVTTAAASIFWHPDSTATGTFAVESGIFLFPTNGRDQEGYGMFVGGSALAGSGQRYTYFLLRNDGTFLVKQRQGDRTVTLTDWTALPAIKRQSGTDAMRNDLRIEVGASSVTFRVNGVEATTLPRAQVQPDGIFGLRLNHAVNAHVVQVKKGV